MKKVEMTGRARQAKGVADNGVVDFSCADCGKSLLCLQKTTTHGVDNSILTRVAVACGFCGGKSYVETIDGQFYAGAPNDETIIDTKDPADYDIETDVMFFSRSK